MNMQTAGNDVAEVGHDDRLEYQAPALRDIGDVNQITRSDGNDSGSDFSYS